MNNTPARRVNRNALEGARRRCGLWRRLAFFLLDSLTVWFFAMKREGERMLVAEYYQRCSE